MASVAEAKNALSNEWLHFRAVQQQLLRGLLHQKGFAEVLLRKWRN